MIVPRLPPAVDGLGDYGLRLARQLYGDYGVSTEFLVGDPDWSGTDRIEQFPVTAIARRTAAAVLSLLASKPLPVLLHYVGYGYANRGCPCWLVDGLHHWRDRPSATWLITLFHEIYATGPVWSSAFWMSPLQRRLAAQLVNMSDRVLTSRTAYAQRLHHLDTRFKNPRNMKAAPHPVTVLPIFSNIGEVSHPPPLLSRPNQVVIFGSAGVRERLYQRSRLILEQICQRLHPEAIHDIGPGLDNVPDAIAQVPVVRHGVLAAEAVQAILLQARVGLLHYPPSYLDKSGIFAAYCAHGLLSLVATTDILTSPYFKTDRRGIFFGCVAPEKNTFKAGSNSSANSAPMGSLSGVAYLPVHPLAQPLDQPWCWQRAQAIATQAHTWYQSHTPAVHAQALMHSLPYVCSL